MKYLVSVIIPIFNTEKYLDQLLNSISSQSYDNIEILLIDDGSSDESEIICKKFQEKNNKIKYYKNKNRGVSYSRNFGIEKAKGDYLVFIDSDDIVLENYIERLLRNIIDSNSDCSICGIKGFKTENQIKYIAGQKKEITSIDMAVDLFNLYGGFLANKMYKMDIIKSNELFLDENIHISEDLLFNLSYFKYCKKVFYDESIMYYYRLHSESSFYNLNNEKWFSVIDTYKVLLRKYSKLNQELDNVITFNAMMTVYEANYRIKKYVKQSYIEERINELELLCKDKKCNFNFRQKIKLFLFRYFSVLVMFYKRSKLKG